MTRSVLDDKRILAVDDEPDVLAVLEDEIKHACHNVTIEKATSYGQAVELIDTHPYDLVILDIMGVRGFDLLEKAAGLGLKVAMLTAHALSPEALKKSHDLGARSYLPKDELGRLVPFLEDVLKYDHETGWKRLIDKLEHYFDEQFEPDWKKKWGIGGW
jgi:DNA-binding NtrC family response regulator